MYWTTNFHAILASGINNLHILVVLKSKQTTDKNEWLVDMCITSYTGLFFKQSMDKRLSLLDACDTHLT